MGKTYTTAPKAVEKLVETVMKKHHPTLAEFGVKLTLLMVSASRNDNGEPTGPALKLHGYPCRAIIKINSLKDRVAGLGDATIQIDGDEYESWPDDEKAAVIDHELTHLEIARDAEGEPLGYDDANRPRLKMRLHDWELGGFADVVKHYGDAATEKKAFAATCDEFKQLLLPWG